MPENLNATGQAWCIRRSVCILSVLIQVVLVSSPLPLLTGKLFSAAEMFGSWI